MASPVDPLAFAKLVPSFDFMQQFAQATTGKKTHPNFAGWMAPTVNIEELNKRIADLKAVQFWLEQNAQVLRATVQALEVQKMTLATLQGMKLNLADIAKAFTVPEPAAGNAAPVSAADAADAADTASTAQSNASPQNAAQLPQTPVPGAPDPMQWWSAITQQFQTLAASTLKEAAKTAPHMSKESSAAETPVQEAAGKKTAPQKSPKSRIPPQSTPARKPRPSAASRRSSGDGA